MPVLDDRCPTLCVVHQLTKDGWRGHNKTTIVNASNVAMKIYDTRVATRWKPYFQSLIAVNRTLPLTSSIPSGQPGKFYKLLLAGVRAEPYMGGPHYTLAVNDILKKKGKLPLPLENVALKDEPVAAPALMDYDDDAIVGAEPPQPAPKPKPKPKATAASGSGDGVPQPSAPLHLR